MKATAEALEKGRMVAGYNAFMGLVEEMISTEKRWQNAERVLRGLLGGLEMMVMQLVMMKMVMMKMVAMKMVVMKMVMKMVVMKQNNEVEQETPRPAHYIYINPRLPRPREVFLSF
jgi:hypothetical protein